MNPPASLSISQLAGRAGVPPTTLRFYEKKGLITAERSPGNQRRYAQATLRRVAFIRAGVAAGIPLARLADSLAELPGDRIPSVQDWERLSRHWRAELDGRIETLAALRDRLTGCIGCGCMSLAVCARLNPGDEAAREGPGARYLPGAGPDIQPRTSFLP